MGLIGALLGGGQTDSDSPTVVILDPPPGGPLAPRGAITFRIMDETGLRRALPMMRYYDATTTKWRYEVIHDGDDFTADFFGTREAVTDGGDTGYQYIVRRIGGWPRAPDADGNDTVSLVPFAWDAGGNEPT